jgi:hypothetical protein
MNILDWVGQRKFKCQILSFSVDQLIVCECVLCIETINDFSNNKYAKNIYLSVDNKTDTYLNSFHFALS